MWKIRVADSSVMTAFSDDPALRIIGPRLIISLMAKDFLIIDTEDEIWP